MINDSTRAVPWRALQAYVIALPFMVITRLPVIGNKLQPADLIFLVWLVATGCAMWREKESFRITPVGYGAAALGSVGLLSAIFSPHLSSSLMEVIAWWYMGLLYLLVINTVRSWKQWSALLELWVVVSTVVASLGILGVMLGYAGIKTPLAVHYPHFFSIRPHPFWVGTSTFFASPTPNMVYGYLHAGVLFGIGLLCSPARRWPRAWYLTAILLHAAAIVLAFSRGWVAFLAGVFVFLWPFRSWAARALGYTVFSALVLLASWTGLFTTYSITHVATEIRPLRSVLSPAEIDEDYAYLLYPQEMVKELHVTATYAPFMRPFLRHAALQMFAERPWLGVGPGAFASELYRRQAEQGTLWGGLRVTTPWDPHSTYFGALAEGGLAGCAALACLLGAMLWQLFCTLKARLPVDARVVMWAVAGCMVGYLVFALDEDMLTKRWFWFTMALGGSAFMLARPRVHPHARIVNGREALQTA